MQRLFRELPSSTSATPRISLVRRWRSPKNNSTNWSPKRLPTTFLERVRTSFDAIINDHPGETVAAVCHGGVISVVLNDILGMPIETYHDAKYTSVSRIAASRDGRRSMTSFNECHWLREIS